MGIMSKQPYGYSKMDMEDPDETSHRKAQFLIYKALERADSSTKRRPSWLGIRVSKLKIKIGRRMKKLKKYLFLNMSNAKYGLHKQVVGQSAGWKSFFGVRVAVVHLPPVFKQSLRRL